MCQIVITVQIVFGIFRLAGSNENCRGRLGRCCAAAVSMQYVQRCRSSHSLCDFLLVLVMAAVGAIGRPLGHYYLSWPNTHLSIYCPVQAASPHLFIFHLLIYSCKLINLFKDCIEIMNQIGLGRKKMENFPQKPLCNQEQQFAIFLNSIFTEVRLLNVELSVTSRGRLAATARQAWLT